jgi:sulfonate transport system permease protein
VTTTTTTARLGPAGSAEAAACVHPVAGPTPPAPVPPAATSGRRFRGAPLLRLISPLLLLGLWQVLSSAGVISERQLSSPRSVVAAAIELWGTGQLPDAIGVSLQRVVIGVGLGIGVVLALVSGFSRLGELTLDPPLQMLRTVPFLGLVPLFILWFGIGEAPKVLLVALGVTFPLYLNLFAGIRGVDSKLVEAARTLGLRRFSLARHVVLPGALPQALVGLRLSLGVAGSRSSSPSRSTPTPGSATSS